MRPTNPPITASTRIQVTPHGEVTYYTPVGGATRIVKVRRASPESIPEIRAYVVNVNSTVESMWLYVDDLNEYVRDSMERLDALKNGR